VRPEAKYSSIGWTAARLARQVELALATIDLSSAQYRALVQLAAGSEASTSLAKQLAVSAPSVTAVVDGLSQRGAVERTHSTEDRRRVSLTLTDKGRELLQTAEAAVSERLTTLAGELEDPARIKAALDALALWGEALDRARARRLAAKVGTAPGGAA
jgi:DNA-binding MarR family transcriptional regulator